MKFAIRLVAAAVFGAAVLGAHAQGSYPNKTVRIVVPYVPGGTVDLVARVLAQRLTEQTAQSFIVDNRAGASGAIGSDAVAKAAPDGYTLLVQSPTLIANTLMVKSTPYDVIRDFTPISMMGSVPMVMTVNEKVPARDLKELIAAARANPKQYSFGTSAIGSPMHVALEAIKHDARLDVPVIGYKGTAAAINDILGGQISAIIDAIPSSAPHIASGKLRAIAVTTKERVASLPNVPTVAEQGFPEFEMSSWYGLWGPAKLPDDVTRKLADEVAKAMKAPLVTERLAPQGFIASGMGPQAFQAFITKETAMYTRTVRDANIRIDQ